MLKYSVLSQSTKKVFDFLVIIFHGYGSNMHNLSFFEDVWQDLNAVFVCVQAPEPCPGIYEGFQWFPLQEEERSSWFEKETFSFTSPSLQTSHDELRRLIEKMQETYGLRPNQTILTGFSQGAMMALDVGLKSPFLAHHIVAYSGCLLREREFQPHSPSILFIHGEQDDVVPLIAAKRSYAWLKTKGFKVRLETVEGLAHSIDQKGLFLGLESIKGLQNAH